MKLIKEKKQHQVIDTLIDYKLRAVEEGLYVIEISARAKSEKQIGATESDDADLRMEIDDRTFPQRNNPTRYLDSPAAFSGGKLHNRRKTVFFCIYLSKGNHIVKFVPDRKPALEEIRIKFAGNGLSSLSLNLNYTAEDGDRRPWLTFVLVDLPLKRLETIITTERRFLDSDDVKIIIDDNIRQNLRGGFRKLWFWLGSLLRGKAQINLFAINRGRETHYVELHADRMPTLQTITFDFGIETRRTSSVFDPIWTGHFIDDTEQMILARAIFGEARDEIFSDNLRIAVGWSIRNRVTDSRWGNTYNEVITEEYQYSAFNEGDDNRKYVENPLRDNIATNKKAWINCYTIAGQVISGEVSDQSEGANHYFSDFIDPPFWSKAKEAKFIKKIDNTSFYNLGK